ncbi:MAG: tetratricopeptide repeat protein [Polyangiales bacterium]|nr:tetratricopeptide repeat protein [Myxococcales bacterium]
MRSTAIPRLMVSAMLLGAPLACAVGCGGAPPAASASTLPVPARVSAGDFAEALRKYTALSPGNAQRAKLRRVLATHYIETEVPSLGDASYESLVGAFSEVAALHEPADFESGDLAPELVSLARQIRGEAAKRGDEAVVLAALLILRTAGVDADTAKKDYDEVNRWGRRARATIDSDLEGISSVVELWEDHATLTPAPEVLAALAKLEIRRRDMLLDHMKRGDSSSMTRQDLFTAPAILRQTPLTVAAIFLEHGDLASARTYVKALGDTGGMEAELIRVLDAALGGSGDALLELAMTYARGKPSTTVGICAYGYRAFPKDSSFPQCLARIAAEDNQHALATAWFRETVRVAPTHRELYDEALGQVREFVERAPADTNPEVVRGMVKQADEIISERERRWPGTSQEIELERFYAAVGMMEMNAGNLDSARARFEAALKVKETAPSLEQLGRIASARGNHAEAVEFFERAKELSEGIPGLPGAFAYAELLGRIGDEHRALGALPQAKTAYESALKILAAAENAANPFGMVEVLMRRGILLDRLDRAKEGARAFREAIRNAENLRSAMGEREAFPASAALQQTYARILSHLAAAPEPNLELAQDIFRAAQRQLTLDPEWKVYFALWTSMLGARSGKATDAEVNIVLGQHRSADAWYGALARFGLGELDEAGLLAAAKDQGQRTEAYFYAFIPATRAHEDAKAIEQLELTIRAQMVNFYEFIMADELLSQRRRSPPAAPAPAQ